MKDKTKVKPKNVWKVAEVLAENPHATYREIEKITELAPATVQKAKNELKQNWSKDETIMYIVWSAKDRLKRISVVFDKYVEQVEKKKKLENKDVALAKDIAKDDLQRITVLWWDATDENGALKAGIIYLPQPLYDEAPLE